MTLLSPYQWMTEQKRLGHSLCLVLDAGDSLDKRQALLGSQAPDQYCDVYSETPVADLAGAGPCMFVIDKLEDEHLRALLMAPGENWGWLASLPAGTAMRELVRRWRERLVVGERPHQALYRFNDNRVLARALQFLGNAAIAEYLGPAASVLYWQAQHWSALTNPKPGNYPVPEHPAWCNAPNEQPPSAAMRELNARRYLLAEHLDAYARLAESHDPDLWLSAQLAQAAAWGWQSAEQLEFLLEQGLDKPSVTQTPWWGVKEGETPAAHFQRVYDEAQFWEGRLPL
jgi:hypothetical protein